MTSTVLLLSGPNLDLLGTRAPAIYGTATLDEHVATFRDAVKLDVRHIQTNSESELIEAVHAARGRDAAIVINAGALSHTSWALRDALDTFEGPKVEVHLSNPAAREGFRHTSTLAGVVNGTIAGFGGLSYLLAARAVRALLKA